MIFMLSLFQWITNSLSFPLGEVKLIAIVNWIFHVSDNLRLFMKCRKCGLILLRYSSTDNALFL